MNYRFYYDESEHSRSIGYKTITAENFYDSFITVIVGWKTTDEDAIQKRYEAFEEKYLDRHPKGELKSNAIQNKQLRYGFASTTKGNHGFIADYLCLFSKEVYVYISTFSKVEYIVNQLFRDYQNSLFIDIDMMKYSIAKALVIYRPESLVDAIYNAPENIISVMKAFFEDRIEKNRLNPSLKEKETESFKQILLLLDDVQPIQQLDWDYIPPFVGFEKFLCEHSIEDYSLTIDREGQQERTVQSAAKAGLKNVSDSDSASLFGIRMADMLAGLIGKLMKALSKALHPLPSNSIQKTILSTEWFDLTDAQLALYKKLHYVICELNNTWYKSYAGIYADDLVCLNALLNYMKHFASTQEIKSDLSLQGEYFNGYACDALLQDYQKKRSKLPFEAISHSNINDGYFFNQCGAKVYFDISKQPLLPISRSCSRYYVFSVGFSKNGTPLVTVKEDENPVCYRLPPQLSDWAFTMVALSNAACNLFPSDVEFSFQNERYCAAVL